MGLKALEIGRVERGIYLSRDISGIFRQVLEIVGLVRCGDDGAPNSFGIW